MGLLMNAKVNLCLVCLTILFPGGSIGGQTPSGPETLAGSVKGLNSGETANVTLTSIPGPNGNISSVLEKSQQTDKNFNFSFENLPAGEYRIVITSDNTAPAAKYVAVPEVSDGKNGAAAENRFVLSKISDLKSIPLLPSAHVVANSATTTGTPYVDVNVTGMLGSMGYVAAPPSTGFSQLSEVDLEQALALQQNFNFPSIILSISTAPVVNFDSLPNGDAMIPNPGNIPGAQDTDINPKWLATTFTLHPMDANGMDLADKGVCSDGTSIQILGLLPSQTTAGTQASTPAEVTGAINTTAGDITGFFPGVGSLITAATSALNVIFGDIFPPKSVAYQYAHLDGNCQFGWFFRPNTSTASGGEASILGVQTGVVLLKTTPNIASIGVTAATLSQWTKAPYKGSDKDLYATKRNLPELVLPTPASINFQKLYDLKSFPQEIDKATAEKILNIPDDQWFTAVTEYKLVTTPDCSYVTNASLAAIFSATTPFTPPTASVTSCPATSPAAAWIKKADAEKMLNIPDDQWFTAITEYKLVTTPDCSSVTNASLAAIFSATTPFTPPTASVANCPATPVPSAQTPKPTQ